MGKNPALLVLDVQVNMFDPAFGVVGGERILATIGGLVVKARAIVRMMGQGG